MFTTGPPNSSLLLFPATSALFKGIALLIMSRTNTSGYGIYWTTMEYGPTGRHSISAPTITFMPLCGKIPHHNRCFPISQIPIREKAPNYWSTISVCNQEIPSTSRRNYFSPHSLPGNLYPTHPRKGRNHPTPGVFSRRSPHGTFPNPCLYGRPQRMDLRLAQRSAVGNLLHANSIRRLDRV